MLTGLGVFFFVLLWAVLPPRLQIVDAQTEPSVTIDLDPESAIQGDDVIALIYFHNLTISSNANLGYRSDVFHAADGSDADSCEGWGMGYDHSLNSVNNNPETVAAITSTDCPVGSYRLRVRLWDANNVELASASADFAITPAPTATPTPTPTFTPTPTPTPRLEDYDGWRGEYYDNADFAGNPVLVRDDADINFNWGSGSPATDVPADNFSVRWERIVIFDEDRIYRFKLSQNDAARVWFDERLIFDFWGDDNDGGTYFTELPVTAGAHTFRVEYREDDSDAYVGFWWQDRGALPTATPTPTITPTAEPPLKDFTGWRGEYYNNSDLHGEPVLVRDDPNIDYNWDRGSPAAGVPTDMFSARWERIVSFDAGLYKFSVQKDDGARVWIDGQLIIDRWLVESYGPTYSADVTLTADAHTIRVEYFENYTYARIKFWWEQLSPTSTPTPTPTPTPTVYATRQLEKNNRWRAEFYPNQILSGIPAESTSYSSLNFNWGSGDPRYGLPDDHFSARFDRIVTLDGGLYRFSLEKDDGARVWVDDQLLIDHWKDCCDEGERFEAELPLIAGDHTIRVEYYEKEGNARINFWWNRIGPLPTPAPTPAPWSATLTVGSGGGYSGYGLSTGGTLSDTNFAWRNTTYTLEAILHNPFSDTVSVEFADDIGAERENLTFCLGATQLDLAQARSPNHRQFFWDNVDPGWSDGDTVTVGVHGCGG